MSEDLRSYLKELKEAGEILQIDKEVDTKTQMGGLVWSAQNRRNKATFFTNLRGYPGWKAASYLCGSRRRISLGLKTTPEKFIPELRKRLESGLTPCKIVKDGPVKEKKLLGKEADINKLPIHVMSALDGGPYIGSGISVVKDPESGIRNISLHRNQMQGIKQLGILIHPGRHLDIVYKKYEEMNKPMPVAIFIGHHAVYYLASCWTTAFGIDELEIAGTLKGSPVELVKCETIDLEVPAQAEIVIEGELIPRERKEEGPFAEHTGYARAGGGLNPFIRVKAITMRKDAIYYALQGGRPIAESQILDAMPMEVVLYNRIKEVGGNINLIDVLAPPYAGGCHIIVIQMVPEIEGQVKNALMATLSSPYLHPKIAIAVDEDVDPHDPTELFWSISTRVNPAKDIFIVPDTHGHHLDASLPMVTPKGAHPIIRLGSKMGIDATKPVTRLKEERDNFERSIPKGLDKFRLEDFL